MCLLPCQIFAHLTVGIAVTMGFVVCFVHHVDSPSVAEFIQVFAVRIMRCSQKVDVGLFHQSDVLLIGGIVNIATSLCVMIMTIHATQFHVLAINFENLANYLNLLHTKMIVEVLDGVTLSVLKFHAEGVEIRFLGRP